MLFPVRFSLLAGFLALLSPSQIHAAPLRCGYSLQAPFLVREDTTKSLSGPAVTLMSEIASQLDRKLEWVEETTPEKAAEGLKSNRFDVFCTPLPRWAPQQTDLAYTQTLFFSATYIYARAEDRRFDNNDTRLNAPDITIAVREGTPYSLIQKEEFAKARGLLLPAESSPESILQAVVNGRADATFASPLTSGPYLDGHKERIRPILGLPPFRIHAYALAVSKEKGELLQKLDGVVGDQAFQKRLRGLLINLPITFK